MIVDMRKIVLRLLPVLSFSLLPAQSLPPAVTDFLGTLQGQAATNPRGMTPALLWVQRHADELTPAQKQILEQQGFLRSSDRQRLNRSEAEGLDQFLDTPFFRIHYTTTGTNAVAAEDLNQNSVPDYIDDIAAVFDSVYTVLVDQLLYYPPPGDGWVSTGNGGNGLYDIYVRNIQLGYYGYTQSEYFAQNTGDNEQSPTKEQNALTSYMALRNSYSGFPHSARQNIRVTAAHEFFHAIQFGYDGYEAIWLLEATAVWMEEVMFDNINDCYQYMPTWFQAPELSLDAYGIHMYGSYIFFRYVDENWNGKPLIRAIFDASVHYDSQEGTYDFQAIRDACDLHHLDFRDLFNGMVMANRIFSPVQSASPYRYREAHQYPVDGPTISRTIHGDTTFTSSALRKYGSQYFDLDIDHPVRVTLSAVDGHHQNVKALGMVATSPNDFVVYQGWDFTLPSGTYADWISLAVAAQDTQSVNYQYRLSIQAASTTNAPAVIVSAPYPNPGPDRTGKLYFTLETADLMDVSARIIDLQGRQVATLFPSQAMQGQKILSWNGRSTDGQVSPSGVYWLEVSTPGQIRGIQFTWRK
ncbi:MAG: T9SS C-terminal target domain-containing protein [Candidatus Neomarinimicrobiota bacterium]|nr:MAG: T9SS C-terminal target domain-containing protein [Candidatus Neomarinimicrobiota bacterium]